MNFLSIFELRIAYPSSQSLRVSADAGIALTAACVASRITTFLP
jgi:hypothetical protein